jgi:hypothetical protein
LLFLGSSRTENHIDCELIEKLTGKSCINLGIRGTTLQDAYRLTQLMKDRGITYNKAYVQVGYSFNDTLNSESFAAQLAPYKLTGLMPSSEEIPAESNIPFYRYMKNDHVIGFREVFNLLIGKKPAIDYRNGFVPQIGVRNDIVRSLPTEIYPSNPGMDQLEQYFKSNNIKAFYFTAPMCKKALNRDFIEKLKTKIPKLHNYIALYDDKESYFYNCAHLNAVGAENFTTHIVNDLILNNP